MIQSAERLLNPEQKQTSNGNVCRVIKSKDYTTISNIHLRDKSLSLKAKGLLSMVLSLPEDWNYSISGLVSLVREGEFAVKSVLKELKEHKYLLIRKIMPNSETKTLTYEYIFFESPSLYSQEPTYQGLGFQALENQTQLNIDKLNIDKLNTEIKYNNNKPKFKKPTIEEIRTYCQEKGISIDCAYFFDYYESNGWKVSNSPMKDWQATVRNWARREKKFNKGATNGEQSNKYAGLGRSFSNES